MRVSDILLKFWFETCNLAEAVGKREIWFKLEPAFDAAIRDQFLTPCKAAMAGELDELKSEAAGVSDTHASA